MDQVHSLRACMVAGVLVLEPAAPAEAAPTPASITPLPTAATTRARATHRPSLLVRICLLLSPSYIQVFGVRLMLPQQTRTVHPGSRYPDRDVDNLNRTADTRPVWTRTGSNDQCRKPLASARSGGTGRRRGNTSGCPADFNSAVSRAAVAPTAVVAREWLRGKWPGCPNRALRCTDAPGCRIAVGNGAPRPNGTTRPPGSPSLPGRRSRARWFRRRAGGDSRPAESRPHGRSPLPGYR